MKRKIFLFSLLLVLLLSACNNTNAPSVEKGPEKGGQVNLKIKDFNVNPLSFTGTEFSINNLNPILYRGLMKYDENLKLTASLAESIKIDEDVNEVKIILKDNIKWHDDTIITVDDVKFTYEVYSDSNYNGYWKSFTFNILGSNHYRTKDSENISGIIVDSVERSIVIQYDDLTAKDLELLTAPLLSKEQFIDKSSILQIKELSSNGKLLSNGPFKIEEYSDSLLTLTRNDLYEEDVYLDKINISNNTDQLNYDFMLGVPADTKNKLFNLMKVLTIEGHSYEYLGINLNSPIFEDQTIRKAIASVINYTDISKNIYSDFADKPLSPIHPQSWAYVANSSYYKLGEAKTKLNDKNIHLQLAYEDTLVYQLLAEQVAKDLTEAGLEIQLNPIQKDKYIPELFSKGDFDLFLASWEYEYDPIYENKKWLAKNDVLENGYNVSHVNDKVSDDLLLQGGSVTSEDIRLQYYNDWQSHFMDQYYIVPLVSPQIIIMYQPNFHINITNSLVPYIDIQNWWIENVGGKK